MSSEGRPAYGRRLLPSALDELAETSPNRLYAAIPKTADVNDGFRDITVADVARGANFMAKWIEDKFGRSESFETLTYIGVSDLRGPIVFQAAVKCGYKLLLPSPRNPPAVNVSLMNQTGSTKLLHAAEITPIVKQVPVIDPSIRLDAVPSFDEMMDSAPEPYPFKKSFDEARDDPVVVLHSSGSTGIPKPITMTHGTFAALDNQHNLTQIPGRKNRDSTIWLFDGEARIYTVFPFFHLGGFLFLLVNAIFRNASSVLGPPHMVPDGPLLKNIMMHQKLRAMFLVPAVIEQVLQEPNGIDFFKGLDFVAYSGAPSTAAVGDRLSKVVELLSPFGSTETILVPELAPAREDWAWHEFHPHYKHELQLYDPAEGTYELVIFPDEANKDIIALYHNLPGVTEYRTRDLFTRHPDKPDLYKYYGRRDDIIVLANGEKFNPLPLEAEVQSHPDLKGALVIGNGRTQAALLVEPTKALDEAARSKLLEDLLPFVEKSNSLLPGQGRIPRGKLICALPDKPFSRTGKGTVVRKLTEQIYKPEIENLYSDESSQKKTASVSLKASLKPVYEHSVVVDFLRTIVSESFVPGATIGEDEDFFSYGLDSVQTLEITSNLKRNLKDQTSKSVSWITPRTIFRHSSLADLARLLAAFLNEKTVPEEDSDLARARAVDETVAQYVEGLPDRSALQAVPSSKTSTVAVIGSTGYLGAYIVATLLKNPDITQVYCLNRSSDAQQRQEASLRQLDNALEQHLHKLVYMTVELGKPLLGLGQDKYDLIVSNVDVVVYNAWRLDFGLAIRSFSPFLRATRDLIDLSAASKRNTRIVFVSSISSVASMASKATVPEAPVDDPLAALNIGYGQSKLAAERILASATRKSGVPVTIVRVCQVGGPSSPNAGTWADQAWISAVARTAKALKCFPSDLVPIDWVPVDTVAAMLHAFILQPAGAEAQVFNIYPPKPQPWTLLVDVLREGLDIKETVPLREWTRRLRAISNPTADDLAQMPALKMLDYYEALGDRSQSAAVATDRASRTSQVQIPTVDKAMVEAWLRDWDL
ncbi:Uu.00g069150.m01.CDS01 [Anthostomella pinea]|uniref:Uu.00g069150.m01.CDS01 n=1 Tax=Anthostomella pinea TaxID=933095 RepID=A0AAI8VV35_9PEZI|nr:Uu.00g069150.m01.CDS01 [Anthostomella pinea]